VTEREKDLDVAITFLSRDLSLATTLRDELGSKLNVFVYTEKQEELAGTDGLESFREVFRHRARLVVILHREGWGDTDWTNVERQAIEERFLKDRTAFLFVIMLDDSQPPPWLPQHLIRFNLKDFSVEQAVGAIKARALDLGSVVQKPSPAFSASRAREIAEFGKRRGELFGNELGARQACEEAQKVISLISARAAEIISTEPTLNVEYGADPDWCVIKKEFVAVHVSYRNRIINNIREAKFVVRELRGPVLMPRQQGYYYHEPRELGETVYLPELDRALGWCWKLPDGKTKTNEEVADFSIARFFALIDAEAAGDLPDFRD